MKINLVLIAPSTQAIEWPLGESYTSEPGPSGLARLVDSLQPRSADAWLFWDPALGAPPVDAVAETLQTPGQVWHAGLRLGLSGYPHSLDFVSPTWMLNVESGANQECTSWRLSLRACLIRSEVLEHCGGPWPGFQALDAASLELGHRYFKAGVVIRFVPSLVRRVITGAATLPLADEVRFVHCCFSRFWTRYAVVRMALTGFGSPLDVFSTARRVLREPMPPKCLPLQHADHGGRPDAARVTVLIPTVDRYPYLKRVLAQLQTQTVLPAQIVIVDQTAPARRDPSVPGAAGRIPVRLLHLDRPGQCSARNAGLAVAEGDYVLFIDDDDEIETDLIERHLANLSTFRAEVSCGVADEAGAGPIPADFTFTRVSDVFPTNNSMIRIEVLQRSGLFDLAYDRGSRADGDLGMRLHLSGALMILNPSITLFHHHAPQGGLRTHKARKITYASSRTSLLHRHLPSQTECYLWQRYFGPRQIREEIWLRALGTLIMRGGRLRKMAKAALGVALLPHTFWTIRKRMRTAKRMFENYPSIPVLQRDMQAELREVS